jgi:quercetin dioxygenase-like cupin family protein
MQMQAWRLADVAWQDRGRHESARLVKDAETGAEAILVRYPAGSVTADHVHPCAHGLMVIAGRLWTQDGTFGPGDVVWYPEGIVGSHGATAEGPVTVLLFTNQAFGIDYVQK